MDVRCTRCGTEYEFDDALISERGTSVRCTQCGYQFRVYPPQTKSVGPDEWVVLTNLGRRVVYRSLRELQSGISRGEVAREDLLARGTAPPRPLGSIAELDPLFSTKTAPERKSSTLTGVAPPNGGAATAAGAGTGAQDSDDNSALRAQHDTWSGVAPQAKIKDLAELAARPSPPMRVGGSRTVIGIGEPAIVPTREPPPPVRAPQASDESASVGAGESASVPPETVSFESPATEAESKAFDRTMPLAQYKLGIGAALGRSESEETSREAAVIEVSTARGDSEPPTLPPPPSAPLRERTGTHLGLGDEPNLPLDAKGKAPLALASNPEAAVPPFQAQPQPSIEPPTRRVVSPIEPIVDTENPERSQLGREKTQMSATAISASSASVPRSQSNERLSPRGSEAPEQKSVPRNPSVRASETSRPDAVTRPPSRPHHAKAEKKAVRSLSVGTIALGLLLLAGAGFVGMKLVALKLDHPRDSADKGSSARQESVSLATAGMPENEGTALFAPIDEVLEAGDSDTASRLLAAIPAARQSGTEYLTRRIFADAMSVDMLWWQARLVPASDATGQAAIAQSLSTRLTDLDQKLQGCRADADCKLRSQAAYWALCRMQKQLERAQPPKQGTVDANGLYQLAMLDWVSATTPDKKTLERLKKARLTGVEQGPRVTALIVALIDTKRFDDARTELANLASAAKAHPHLDALNAYLRTAQEAPDAGRGPDASVPESADLAEQDIGLREPDFRIRLQRAVECLSRSEITKAQKLFRSVLAERPNDTEAITGMGDIHRRRGELSSARTAYDKALGLNANYLPAMVGSADVRWQSGDRAGAVGLYRRIVERVGESPGYGQTAVSRIHEYEGSGEPKSAVDAKPAKDDALPPSDGTGKTP